MSAGGGLMTLVPKGGAFEGNATDNPPLEGVIGYRFSSVNLLKEALSHRSYASESGNSVCNERLEFLGDSVLSTVVAHRLYQEYSQEDEGHLSKRKSRIVSRLSLARWAARINLGAYLYLGVGEEQSGGRARPSLLGNALEALIGAIYLDGGYASAEKFIHRLLEIGQESSEGEFDYKSELQEYAQKKSRMMPVYQVTKMVGPDHDKTFEVTVLIGETIRGYGHGKNKKAAEQNAAREALKLIKGEGSKKAH